MKIQENINLASYNTFGIDCISSSFVKIKELEELEKLFQKDIDKFLVLGGGSNILFTQDFDGLIIKNEISGIEKISEDSDSVKLKVGAGENWHKFVLHAVDNNLSGIENLSLIPGTVGAAPIQNIGAYGVEGKDVIHSVNFYHLEHKKHYTYNASECQFGYRDSIFKNDLKGKFVITSVVFELSKNFNAKTSYGAIEDTLTMKGIHNPTIKDISEAVIEIRQSKLPDPEKIGNAGSFFKNPVIPKIEFDKVLEKYPNAPHYTVSNELIKVPAGWLIQEAGWKGKTFEHIGIHPKQALVLVNYGGGKGKDIKQLAYDIQNDVYNKFNILISPEVNMI